MFKLRINDWAEKALEKIVRRDKRVFLRISNALDDLEANGYEAANVKSLKNAPKIFRKRVGRWRILFTINRNIIDVWIIAVEKDTDKDYKRWIRLIACR